MKRLRQLCRGLVRNEKGGAAVELAVILPALVVPMLSVIDLGIYAYDRIQVSAAAQAGVVAVQTTCGYGLIPATNSANCTQAGTLYTAINNAVQSTSLGNSVSVANGCSSGGACWDIESYYCANSSNVLVSAATSTGTTTGRVSTNGGSGTAASTTATDCSIVGSSSTKPGDYVKITTTFTYTPLFPGISVGTLLAGTITSNAWMRLE